MRTPIGLLRSTLESLEAQQKVQADIAALATAKLATVVVQVAHGMSGSKKPCTSKPKDFLPYAYQPEGAKRDGPSEATSMVLLDLLRTARIPLHIFQALKEPASPENE